MKQTLKIGITVLVVAGLAMSGIALAQTDDDAPAVEDTRAYQVLQEKLGPLVEDGTITQDQADAVAATLAEGMRHHRGHGRAFKALKATAEFLGMEPDEFREALSEYATLAQIAEANGSSGEALIDHLVDLISDKLDEAVDAGKITAEEAAEKLANAEERITELVNSEIPERNDFPNRGRRGPGGFGGAGTDA